MDFSKIKLLTKIVKKGYCIYLLQFSNFFEIEYIDDPSLNQNCKIKFLKCEINYTVSAIYLNFWDLICKKVSIHSNIM